jgi:hypothetical protein
MLGYVTLTERGRNPKKQALTPATDPGDVPATQGATTCFWMADDRLGVTLESENNAYLVMVYSFSAGELTLLIE